MSFLGAFGGGGGGGSVAFEDITGDPMDNLALASLFNDKQDVGDYITALTGEVTATGPSGGGSAVATVTNSAVIGKVLTGYTSGAGTVAATDTILQAVQKLNGNAALKVTGPGSATDNAQARFDGAGGATIQNGKWIEDDNGRITVDIGDTSSGATYGTRWTATLTGGAGTINAIERLDITTAGSGAGAFVMGRWVRLLSGYTGGGMCVGDWVINNCASTGSDLNGGAGNMGYRVSMGGSGNYSASYYGTIAASSTRMFGCLMENEAGGSSGVNVGYGTSVHPGTGTLKAACFYGKLTGTVGQAPTVSAVAVFDNAATTFPGLVVQDNGTTMFSVEDKSNVVCGAQSAVATNATDGFLYIPSCAGVPSGTPTAYTGKIALIFDSSNNDLYVYNTAWKKVTLT